MTDTATLTPGPIQFTAFAADITLSATERTIGGHITVLGIATKDYRKIILHPGALQPRLPLAKVKLLRDHDSKDPVGFMLSLTDLDTTKPFALFKVAPGENGDRALFEASPEVKLRDGLSVGISVLDEPGAYLYDEATGEYHVYAAELLEVSVCAIPAYSDAQVTIVNASHQNTPTPSKELSDMNDQITLTPPVGLSQEALDTTLAAFSAETDRMLEARLEAFNAGEVDSSVQFESYGQFVLDFANGTQEARDFALAYTGASTADDFSRNAWLADAIHLVEKARKVINTFTREPLPDKGMTLEYAKLATNTIAVGKQAVQGDDLVQGKITLTTDTTPISTYGGYTELSLQTINRASTSYLTTTFKAMLIEYARATEAAVRTVLNGLITTRLGVAGGWLPQSLTANAYAYLDLLVDASELFEDKGYGLDGALVSKDVFKKLLRLEDTNGNSLMRVWGTGMNQVGEIIPTGAKGELAGVQFKILNGAAANTMAFYDTLALTVWEDSSPTRLEQPNVKNLTEGYSVYGSLAAASQFPDALVPVKFA